MGILMSLDWRNTLRKLAGQFEAHASQTRGLHHLMVEARDERNRMTGPPWFAPFARPVEMTHTGPKFGKWDVCASRDLPGVEPGYREPIANEPLELLSPQDLIRDGSGVVRAIFVPSTRRPGYLCGRPSEEITGFESLANAAARALAGSNELDKHVFASDLVDIFRKPHAGVRYVFGTVPGAPKRFLAQGWDAGVLNHRA
jgi:hypothetical protein